MAFGVIKWFGDEDDNPRPQEMWGWRYYCSNCEAWFVPRKWHDDEKTDFPEHCKNCQTTINRKYRWYEAKHRMDAVDYSDVERIS